MKKKIVIAAIALASVIAGTVAFESFTGQNEAKAQEVILPENPIDCKFSSARCQPPACDKYNAGVVCYIPMDDCSCNN